MHNATYINFEFDSEPLAKNFSAYTNNGMQRDEFIKYEFTVQAGCSFSVSSDGEVCATKEEPAINGDDLYIASNTQSTSFYIIEYIPGSSLSLPVKLYIYNTNEEELNVKSVAVKEIADIAGGIIQ